MTSKQQKHVLSAVRKILAPLGFQYSQLNGWRYGTTPVAKSHVPGDTRPEWTEWLVLRNATTLMACLVIRIKQQQRAGTSYYYELLWEPAVLLFNEDSTIKVWSDQRLVTGTITL